MPEINGKYVSYDDAPWHRESRDPIGDDKRFQEKQRKKKEIQDKIDKLEKEKRQLG